jgi:aspartate-semialdehyde dehydrogenase
MVRTLEERDFPLDDLVTFASERSAGMRLPFRGSEVVVRPLDEAEWKEIDLALFSAGGERSRELVPRATAAGTLVVDNSSAFRMHPEVPLVIPEINPEALADHTGLVANPNCTGITMLMALAPLHREAGLASIVVSSYQSVSGMGQRGVRELMEQVGKLTDAEETLLAPDPSSLPVGEVFGRTIAFNVLARVDEFGEGDYTGEERKIGDEARKILGLPELPVAATTVRVPVLAGHSVSVYATFDQELDAGKARAILADAPGVEVLDDPERDVYPTPLDAAGRDDVLVGRIRNAGPKVLMLFSCADNLRKGAALNAVQIAELLVRGR